VNDQLTTSLFNKTLFLAISVSGRRSSEHSVVWTMNSPDVPFTVRTLSATNSRVPAALISWRRTDCEAFKGEKGPSGVQCSAAGRRLGYKREIKCFRLQICDVFCFTLRRDDYLVDQPHPDHAKTLCLAGAILHTRECIPTQSY
jgi:hypothetical protein